MVRFSLKPTAVLAVLLLCARLIPAQATPPSDDQSTLHVYVNLVQIPVLVLNQSLRPMDRIPDSRFYIAVEGVGRIHPARIRMQGDDPIDLALIVDRSVQDDSIWDELPKALGPLIKALQPQDNLSVFAMDGCKALRVGTEMAPFDEKWLRLTAKTVADMRPYKHDRHRKDDCPKPLTYWDMVTYAANRLSQYQGRKLIVTLGPGAQLDLSSAAHVHSLLTNSSITLFPIVHGSVAMGGMLPYAGGRQIRSGSQVQEMAMVNPGIDLNTVMAMDKQAELSGGVLLGTSQRDFAKTLAEPVTLARGRYIIEFPRPDSLPAGEHHISVADGHPRDFIRPAGISVPVADANQKRSLVAADGVAAATASAATPDASATHTAETPASTEEKPPAPATSPAPQSTAAAVTPVGGTPAKPVAAKPPEPDLTDITGDLRPSH